MKAKSRTVNLVEGSIWKGMLLFALPLMASNLFQQFYNTMDSLVVGQFVGSTALAAVGTTGPLVYLIIGFFVGFGTGSGVIISQNYGAKDEKEVSKSVHTSMAIAIIFGVVLGVVGVLFSPLLLRLINTPDDVMDQAVLYLRIYFGGVITLTIYNIGSGIMRAIGDSKKPFYYLIISGVSNVILNLLFVIVLRLEVAGVALATILSQLLSSILVIRDLVKAQDIYRLDFRKIHLHKDVLLKIAKIGVPAGLQTIVVSLSNIVTQSKINIFGSIAMAGHSAGQRIDGFIYMPLSSFSLTMTTFTAQNLGAGQFDRVKKGTRTAMLMGFIATAGLGGLAVLLARPLIGIFSSEEEVIAYGIRYLTIIASTYFTVVVNDTLVGVIQGSGNAFVPMIISMSNMCIARILWMSILLSICQNYYLVLICYPITWTTSSLCYLIYYLKGKWREPWINRGQVPATDFPAEAAQGDHLQKK